MSFEIIDFHTHPFLSGKTNICAHKDFCNMDAENTLNMFKELGVSKICGSVISTKKDSWDKIKANNDEALRLKELYGDFYIPGFHVHPDYTDESVKEIDRMHKRGVTLVGELVPYLDGWDNYASDEFSILLDEIGKRSMIVSLHTAPTYNDAIDEMVKRHKDVIFVAAHPGEYDILMCHIERMRISENYYLDISGTGTHRYGMLRRVIDEVGADRILFGSDFPTCNPGAFIGAVLLDPLLSDSEKEKIFSLNAKQLLKIK